MSYYIQFGWVHFCVALGIALALNFIMYLQSRNFYTLHIIIRKFSILDLEFPASPLELVNYIKGIFLLPVEHSRKVLQNLRGYLFIDFLFMIAAYSSVFILCMKVSARMVSFGHWIFALLAWLQIIPFVCDIIENIYLLKKIKPSIEKSSDSTHKTILILELCKWIIPLTAVVCCLASIAYYWLVGNYHYNSLEYLILIISELALFIILKKATAEKRKEKSEEFL